MSAREILRAYEDGLKAQRFEAVAPFVHKDAVFWFSDGEHRGHTEIEAAMNATWAALPDERYWLTDQEWIAETCSLAVCRYRFHWVSGQRTGHGRGTTVLQNGAADWQITHEHLSADH